MSLIRFGTTDNPIVNRPGDVTASNATDLKGSVINVINAIIAVLGLVAVVVIILGGVQYMTSAGDSGKVKKAKDTILYGVIGLIVCIIAAAIVNFVIANLVGGSQQQSSGGGGGQAVPLGTCVYVDSNGSLASAQGVPQEICERNYNNGQWTAQTDSL